MYKKSVFWNFAKFTEKQLYWSLIFDKVTNGKPAALLKRHNGASVFVHILSNSMSQGTI